MWYKIEKICLLRLNFSVGIIISMNQVMGRLALMCKCIKFFFVGTTANIYLAEKKLGVANYTIEGYKYFTLLYS